MRIKTYIAPNTAEAMRLVREELGDDAIIVATESGLNGEGVRITAALEAEEEGVEAYAYEEEPAAQGLLAPIESALMEHGTPRRLRDRLLMAARTMEADDAHLTFAAALDSVFTFAPLPERSSNHPFILVGPPGSGKTVTAAKLAARSVLKGYRVGLVTTDIVRAGAVEQLTSFTRILEIDLKTARGPESLRRAVENLRLTKGLTFIDTPGLNPFNQRDMTYLTDLVNACAAEVVLVMAAGGDPEEAAEIAEVFAEAGAQRLLATRLDTTRRLGGIMMAAYSGNLMFCDVGFTPHISEGLSPITPISMARLILPPEDQNEVPSMHEAMS